MCQILQVSGSRLSSRPSGPVKTRLRAAHEAHEKANKKYKTLVEEEESVMALLLATSPNRQRCLICVIIIISLSFASIEGTGGTPAFTREGGVNAGKSVMPVGHHLSLGQYHCSAVLDDATGDCSLRTLSFQATSDIKEHTHCSDDFFRRFGLVLVKTRWVGAFFVPMPKYVRSSREARI